MMFRWAILSVIFVPIMSLSNANSDNSMPDFETGDFLSEVNPTSNSNAVDCSSQASGPLGQAVTDIHCKLPTRIDLKLSGLLDSSWTDESLKNGKSPKGIRRYVDWRYKFGNRPVKRSDDAKYWMGFSQNVRQCGGTCPSAAFFHFLEFSRVVQTLYPYESSSWTYGYAHRLGANIRNTFRKLGMPLDRMDDTLSASDCRYRMETEDGSYTSRCVDGSDTYRLFNFEYGKNCKKSGSVWWETMAMRGMNGVKSVPNANILRGGYAPGYFFRPLRITKREDGYHTSPWTVSDNFSGYSQNAILMYLIDHFGPVIMSYTYSKNPNKNSYLEQRNAFYKTGNYGDMRYGSDILIGKELPGQSADISLLKPGDSISSPHHQHVQLIVGYRYIPESPESSYWITLNSHGDTNENGFEYFHMPIGTTISNILYFWLPAMYWNQLGMPIRYEKSVNAKQCAANICEFDQDTKTCKCIQH